MSYLLDTNAFIDHLRHGSASSVTVKLLAAAPDATELSRVPNLNLEDWQ